MWSEVKVVDDRYAGRKVVLVDKKGHSATLSYSWVYLVYELPYIVVRV